MASRRSVRATNGSPRTSAAARLAGIVAATLTVAGCQLPRFGAPEPASRQAGRSLALWQGTVIAAAIVGAFVWALIVWSVLRYRRTNDDIPNQNPYNVPIEILYTAVPVLIVAILFFFTMRTQSETAHLSKRPDVIVDVIGFQWQWQFRYPREAVVVTGNSEGDPPAMVLPVGATVRLRLKSTDVDHSFWVPRFLSKRDLIPGVRNEIDVDVTRSGRFVGRCAEFCGLDHWRMNFEVRAVSRRRYRAWLVEQRSSGGQR